MQIQIPYSDVLHSAGAGDQSEKDIDEARRKVVRASMDSLIGVCGGRPTDLEVLQLAKGLATQYPILRDNKDSGIRDNFVSYIVVSDLLW